MSASESTSHSLDFIHHSVGNNVKINRGVAIKDVENLGNGFTKFLGDFALFRSEGGGRLVLGGEIGGGVGESDRRLNAVEDLAVLVYRKKVEKRGNKR